GVGGAVSYTHLDVYKRQVLTYLEKMVKMARMVNRVFVLVVGIIRKKDEIILMPPMVVMVVAVVMVAMVVRVVI
ncbi:hypothetical protein QHH03_26895, partial [Aphanizomenon sp. 202]|nr:hypothetical protein [Aphanizomenon sp. 202]